MSPFTFTFNDKDFHISPKDYLITIGEFCFLGFQGDDLREKYVIGNAFFRSFYTLFDLEFKRVGLVTHIYSNGYSTYAKTKLGVKIFAGVEVGVIALIFLGLYIWFNWSSRPVSDKKDEAKYA